MLKAFVAILLFLCTCRLASQTPATVSFLTVNDGLSQGMIFDILQSRDGFIWIATKDGLNRYDGSRFEVFSPDPFDPFAIGGSEIRTLFEDSRGWIWVSHQEGLDVLAPENPGRFFHIKHEGNTFISGNFAETPDGSIWLSNADQAWKISIQKDMLEKAADQGNADIKPTYKAISLSVASRWSNGGIIGIGRFLLFTQEQKLLVSTSHGVYRIDLSTGELLPELPLPDCYILWMTESKSGEVLVKGIQMNKPDLWVRMVDGEPQYVEDDLPNYPRPNFTYDDEGYFWVFRDRSIQKWHPSAFFDKGRPEMEISADELRVYDGQAGTAFLVDKSGIVWTGTNGYGIVKINEKGQKFRTVLPGISHRLILEDPAGGFYTTWFPDKKFLSKKFDRSVPNTTVAFDRYRMCRKNAAFDPAGNTWNLEGWSFVTDGTILSRTDAVTKTKKTFPLEGIALLCDRNGRPVSVNEKGLHRFDPATETSQHFLFEKPQTRLSDFSHFLYEDSEGIIWIFGFTGLVKAVPDQNGYRFEQYLNDPADHSSLSINTVLSVADDPLEPQRYLWVGTKGGGLNRLDKASGQFKHYGREEGLPDMVVYGILAQDRPEGSQSPGYIWMSTNKGLCRFDVRAETTKNFTVADGLQDNEFNSASYLKTSDGSLIFGGVNGLNVFHPDSLYFNENVPQVHIVGLKVNNKKVEIGQSEIVLSHAQNLLNFEFAALEFTNPAQNQYRYQLVGVDEDWVALGNKNSIQFAKLTPGDYTFKVDGSNNDGVWSGQPAELRFTIRPPWWATWWAYAIYLAIAATAVWLFYRYRLRQKIQHQEALRLREIDEFKSRFFTNITHEFRTPLTVIMGMAGQIKNHPQEKNLIQRNSENLLRLINQLLDLSRLESGSLTLKPVHRDINIYLHYLAESFYSSAQQKDIRLVFHSDERELWMDFDEEKVQQIVYNLLSNALKFTEEMGQIILHSSQVVENGRPFLKLKVKDTGRGIPAEDLHRVFERFYQINPAEDGEGGTGVGLALVKELAEFMGGRIEVASEPGVGTEFEVYLPITANAPKAAAGQQLPPSQTFDTINEEIEAAYGSELPVLLIIEDNPDIITYIKTILAGQYSVHAARNGFAGIEQAIELVPDLIISDVMMPGKNGYEVCENLKQDERTSHIPIILLTAKATQQDKVTGLRFGADVYLNKPFDQEELLLRIENLLRMRQQMQKRYARLNERPAATPVEEAFFEKLHQLIHAHLSDAEFGVPQLAAAAHLSQMQLYRKLKALTGQTPSRFIRSYRLMQGMELLKQGRLTVSEVAYEVGFTDPSYFSRAFQEEFKNNPSHFLK